MKRAIVIGALATLALASACRPGGDTTEVLRVKDTTGTIQCPTGRSLFVHYADGQSNTYGVCYPPRSVCAEQLEEGRPLPASCERWKPPATGINDAFFRDTGKYEREGARDWAADQAQD